MSARLRAALLFLLAPSVAVGAPSFDDDDPAEAKEAEGLVFVELTGEGACDPVPWEDPAVDAALAPLDPKLTRGPRTEDNLQAIVGKGYRAGNVIAAYRDGDEVDRVCRCLSGPDLAAWIAGVAEGRTAAQAKAKAIAEQRAAGGRTATYPATAYLELVQLHMCAARFDDAFDVLERMWTEIPEVAPDLRQLRLTGIVKDMGAIATLHPPARARIVALRDAVSAAKDRRIPALEEWVVLNRMLRDDAATLAWYEANRDVAPMADLIRHQAPNVFRLYFERERWADAGAVIGDVERWLDIWKKTPGGLDDAVRGYAALLAAGRTKDAADLAKGILKVEAGAACGLISASVEVGATDRSQKKVAKQCDDDAAYDAWAATL